MSKFGQEQLAHFDPLYVPHAVDTSVYRPYPKDESREALGLDKDEFLVGMVAANKGNPSRKCFAEAFQAFQRFNLRHPESRLYLHTEATGRFQGVDLPPLLDSIGVPAEQTSFCDQYRAVHLPFKNGVMAQVYSAMDVLLMPSAGEGFGIPAIEAQSCGTPVIASDFSAQPELVGAGWLVSGTKTYTPIGSWQFRPDVEDITDALEKAWRQSMTKAAAKECSEKARQHALAYDVELVFENQMLPALAEARARLDDRKPTKLKAAA
jgi:glycosyltransferase involved in cell wall biosynthesis